MGITRNTKQSGQKSRFKAMFWLIFDQNQENKNGVLIPSEVKGVSIYSAVVKA